MAPSPEISLVVPAYDEVDRIGATVADVEALLQQSTRSWEMIVVADGGPEALAREAAAAARDGHTYGLVRAEILAALVNGLLMLSLITFIAVEALDRFAHPREIHGGTVTAVAVLGLLINLGVAWRLPVASGTSIPVPPWCTSWATSWARWQPSPPAW